MLVRYHRIISGKQKARFIISKKRLKKITSNLKKEKTLAVKENKNSKELEPLKTATLTFYELSSEKGKEWTTSKTAKWIEERSREGKAIIIEPKNLPKNLLFIIKTLSIVKNNIPIIWKSDGYYSEKIANFLKNLVDVYIIEFKHFSDECSIFLSQKPDYAENVKRNIMIAEKKGDLLVYHQILPNHIECDTKQILEWIRNNLTKFDLKISGEYKPKLDSCEDEVARRITISEYNDVMKHARAIGLNI